MKKAIVLSLLAIAVYCSDAKAQSLPDYSQIKLETKADYNDAADSAALHSANYVLGTPYLKNDVERLKSLEYMIKWMTGTPKYQFNLDESASAFLGEDDNLGMYMAALVKVAINQPEIKDPKKAGLAATKQVLQYMSDPKNQVKMSKKVKALVEADKKGELEQTLYKTKQ
ncbi:hypothetical protein IM792_11410 [Mucilaginibacter sp. JRF]|uniref:hypothetical protein n=1 Tax=Mucilaginibacter sp. JRF TaxID=2780088 RepID=UPI00187E9227|nr:hypothetical protein [Mucilaginibacter sp. JRF]MBE9585058.1 hypothetical protein [Mucilaginibacter sp. JRF]